MAQIADNPTGLGIESVSRAARTLLYGPDGTPLPKLQGAAQDAAARGVPIMGSNDGAYRFARMDRMGNLGTTQHVPVFDWNIEGASGNVQQVTLAGATQTASQGTGTGFALNATSVLAAGGYTFITTLRQFGFRARGPVLLRTRARLIKGGTNGVAEIGFGNPATNAPLTVGAMWQYNASGQLFPVVVYNGTPVSGSTDVAGLIDNSRYYWWDIIVSDDSIRFVIQNPLDGLILSEQTLFIGADAGRMFAAARLPAFARTWVGAVAATGPATQLFIGQMYVGVYDTNFNTAEQQVQASMGLSADTSPLTGVQLAQALNSGQPASAVLSNTAAGYSTLGGRFQFAAIAGAETDYSLFAYQVPTGYQMNVTGVTIDTLSTGAVGSATTPTMFEWDLGRQATAASLAGTMVRRGGLGAQSFPLNTPIGQKGERIVEKFTTPFVVDGGRFLHAILRVPVGAATASQIFRGNVTFEGVWSK